MKFRKFALAILFAALLGAVAASTPSYAVSMFADITQWINTSNQTKSASPTNPLPAGIYPAWGADITVSCNNGGSVTSTQLTAGSEYVLQCGAFKAWVDQGTSAVTAESNADRILLPNAQMPVRVDNATTMGYIAVICTNSQVCVISEDL